MSSRSIPAVAHRRAVIDASTGPSLTPPMDAQAREGAHLLTLGLARFGVGADRPVGRSSRVDPLTTGLGWLAEDRPLRSSRATGEGRDATGTTCNGAWSLSAPAPSPWNAHRW
jgi:hypothetical protein